LQIKIPIHRKIQTHYLQTENISYLLKTLRWKSSTHLASKQTNNSKKKKKKSTGAICSNFSPHDQPDLFQIDTQIDAVKIYFTPVNDYVTQYEFAYGADDKAEDNTLKISPRYFLYFKGEEPAFTVDAFLPLFGDCSL
jgi:hypothetical protein